MPLISDENILDFVSYVVPFQKLNIAICSKLITNKVGSDGESAFSLYNRLLSVEFDSQICQQLINIVSNGRQHLSLQNYVIELTRNIDLIVKGLQSQKLMYAALPLEDAESEIANECFFHYQIQEAVEIPLVSDNICVLRNSPLIENLCSQKLAYILNLSSIPWYPNDNLLFPIVRATIHNSLMVYGLEPAYVTNGQTGALNLLAGSIIQSLSTNISFNDVDTFCKRLMLSIDQKIGMFLYFFFAFLRSLKFKVKQQQLKLLENMNNIILDKLAVMLEVDLNDFVDQNSILPTAPLSTLPTNDVVCEKYISSATVFTVLSSYSKISKYLTLNSFAPICPIQVRFILNTFCYWNFQQIIVDAQNNIRLQQTESNYSTNPAVIFETIKHCVRFNGDFTVFAATVNLIYLTDDEIQSLFGLILKMSGFRCAVIAAQILNFHFNIRFPVREMYSLLSKLSQSQITTLEEGGNCKIKDKRQLNPNRVIFRNVIDLSPLPLKNAYIDSLIMMIRKVSSPREKINIAAKTFINIAALGRVLNNASLPKEHEQPLNLLILFSNGSKAIKRCFYDLMPTVVETDNLEKYKFYENKHFIDNSEIDVLEYYYDCLALNYNIANSFADLELLLKETKDKRVWELLRQINNQAYTINC